MSRWTSISSNPRSSYLAVDVRIDYYNRMQIVTL